MTSNDFGLASLSRRTTSRRSLLGLGAAAGAIAGLSARGTTAARPALDRLISRQGTPAVALAERLTIDLVEEPDTLDPALSYDENAWSVVHSVYDSLVQFNPAGEMEFLLAESYEAIDPLTVEIKLRQGVTFHDGT